MSGTASAESEGVVSKVQVKRQIKTIVEDLENILGDLKDVAKELKEVVHEIDSLTSDLRLEEEMTDSSKTDTMNSSSSSTTTTTASSTEKIRPFPEEAIFKPPPILTVLKKPHPPLPPPRSTPMRVEDQNTNLSSGNPAKANSTLLRNGIFAGMPTNAQTNRDLCHGPKGIAEKRLSPTPLLRHEKNRCSQVTRERVRFSEKVQYHGYCPDCDLQCDMNNTDVHLHSELIDMKISPIHQCSSSPPTQLLENGGGISLSHSFPPANPPYVPHLPPQKPQKTILRKSTTTTV
ncbi:protein Largen [Chanos chanos]|uniref:Protein Largen n=1 Tax=Chanos chanos TaxID=29144 RepID=A0A6J2WNQ6_CHACN|nr:protein Largen [Chanos chanos]